MTYSHEVEHMCVVKKGPNHGPASTGCLQADAERQERCHPGVSG